MGYKAEASGTDSTAMGARTEASGIHSTAMGYRAKANHIGCFVWADSDHNDFASIALNEFAIRADGGVRITSTDHRSGQSILRLDIERRWEFRQLDTGSATSLELVSLDTNGVSNKNFLINTTGRVGIGTTTPAYPLDVSGDIQCTALHETSDDRLKTNIETLDNALNKVGRLRGVSFEWNSYAKSEGATAGERQIGVLASEVESVFPELVSTPENGYKSVDYTKLTAVLIEAVKELKAQNEKQQMEITKLKTLLDQ